MTRMIVVEKRPGVFMDIGLKVNDCGWSVRRDELTSVVEIIRLIVFF